MEQSEKLFQELQNLKGNLSEIEREETNAIDDPGLQRSVLTLITMERVLNPNDQRILQLQGEIEATRKSLSAKRNVYRTEDARISKELLALTSGPIRGFVEDLHVCLARAKRKTEILNTSYDGRRQETILTIKSNRLAFRELKRMVAEAVVLLERMRLQPVLVIEKEARRLLSAVEAFNWKAEETEKISEVDYYRGGPPPAGTDLNYGGPMSGPPG
jgi:hypothetical protein